MASWRCTCAEAHRFCQRIDAESPLCSNAVFHGSVSDTQSCYHAYTGHPVAKDKTPRRCNTRAEAPAARPERASRECMPEVCYDKGIEAACSCTLRAAS